MNLEDELEVESHTENIKVISDQYGNTRQNQVTIRMVNSLGSADRQGFILVTVH